jgi:YHS domain-containing protein
VYPTGETRMPRMLRTVLFALTAVAVLVAPLALAAAPKTAPPAKTEPTAKPYPLETCIVTGEKLGSEQVTYVHDGQEFKFCCKDCIKKFNADPKKYHEKLAEEVAKTPPPAKKG